MRKVLVGLLLCATAVGVSGCVLTKNQHYQVNAAPPNGVYVNIYTVPTSQLHAILDAGCNGDVRCLMQAMKSFEFSGKWLDISAGTLWREALAGKRYGDFAEAIILSMAKDNGEPRCLNLTVRAEFPNVYYPSWSYNWSYRKLVDGNCERGEPISP